MYKLLLALACVTANQEDAKPSRGLRGLRFASFVNTDKGGPEASACLKEGGDCSECCGGCNPKEITDGEDFTGEGECVCFHGTFDSQVTIKLSNHDDCATVVRQGGAVVTIKGEDGVDAIHMDSPDASQDSGAAGYNTNPGQIYGNGGVDHLTCAGNGHNVYGGDYYGYQADGGNFMSCVGNGTKLVGGANADKISCEGNDCEVWGWAGNDDIAVVNPYGPSPGGGCAPGSGAPGATIYTDFINGGYGEDTCTYNGELIDYDLCYNNLIDGYIQSGVSSCENP